MISQSFCNSFTKILLTGLFFYMGIVLRYLDVQELDCPSTFDDTIDTESSTIDCIKHNISVLSSSSECPSVISNGYYLKKNIYGKSVFYTVFGTLRHPSSPAKGEFFITQSQSWPSKDPQNVCESITLTRTGQRDSQPNKCAAVVIVPEKYAGIRFNGHRIGYSARLTNQYQNDFARQETIPDEFELLAPFMVNTILSQNSIKLSYILCSMCYVYMLIDCRKLYPY